MTVDDIIQPLLSPRYEVTGPYPNSTWEVGDILTSEFKNEWFGIPDKDEYDGCSIHINWITHCPNIFRLMPWWEGREQKHLEYFRCADGEIVKLHEQAKHTPSDVYCRVHNKEHNQFYYGWLSLYNLLPATAEEYTIYINTLK